VLVQARALGAAPGDLPGMRALLRATQPQHRYTPSGDAAAWSAAEERVTGLRAGAPAAEGRLSG
jgi:rhamnulokinase